MLASSFHAHDVTRTNSQVDASALLYDFPTKIALEHEAHLLRMVPVGWVTNACVHPHKNELPVAPKVTMQDASANTGHPGVDPWGQ